MNRPPSPSTRRVALPWGLLGALAVLLIATAWLTRDLVQPRSGDAVRYAALARTMVDSGDWVEPRILGRPYFRKPPLMLWLTAASISLLGPTSVAAALPSALIGIALVLLLHGVACRVLGPRAGLFAPLVLLANAGFCRVTATCRMDSLLHLSCLAAVIAARCIRPRALGHGLFWMALAVGFLTKGPGVLLVLPVLMVVSILRRDPEPFGRRTFWLTALVFLVLVVPWYAHMGAAHGSIFWEVHLGRQIVRRLIPTTLAPLDRLIGGFGFLGVIGALGAIGAALAIRDRVRRKAPPSGGPWDRGWWLTTCAVWILAVLIFHLVNRSGFPRYLYHALAPTAILAAYGVNRLIPSHLRARTFAGALMVIALILLPLVGSGKLSQPAPDLEGLRSIVRERFTGHDVPISRLGRSRWPASSGSIWTGRRAAFRRRTSVPLTSPTTRRRTSWWTGNPSRPHGNGARRY